MSHQNPYLYPADILLPDFAHCDGSRWSVVACDQYTSQPEYWQEVTAYVGAAPSTLKLILPEAWLGEADSRTAGIHASMEAWMNTLLVSHPDSMILVRRRLSDGSTRTGLVGCIDLEAYDYHKGAQSLIRATEATVPDRIPPRMTIREGAALELPHIMLLIDDRERTVIEPIAAEVAHMSLAYDHDLMMNSGHLQGYFLSAEQMSRAEGKLAELITPQAMQARYGRDGLAPLLFAVGDGNHSLAAAKACYEKIKEELGEAALEHPARYALCEVVNLYDESLIFEPIYRVVFGVEPQEFLRELSEYVASRRGDDPPQTLLWQAGDRQGSMTVPAPESVLAVGTVQAFLNEYMKKAPAGVSVDYIHGEETARSLAARSDAVAILFDGMRKEELFPTVIRDGALPRKTFSMGHAEDKRFYTEARRIR